MYFWPGRAPVLAIGSVCSQILPGPVREARKNSVAAENHVLDAGDRGDLEGDAGLESSDVAGMTRSVSPG